MKKYLHDIAFMVKTIISVWIIYYIFYLITKLILEVLIYIFK
jgi:hypothetical protein